MRKLTTIELFSCAYFKQASNYWTEGMSIEQVEEEFKRRGFPLPIMVVPAPKVLIIYPLEVEAKKSTIIKLESKAKEYLDMYKYHPLQGLVYAYDPSLKEDIPALAFGVKVYLKSGDTGIFRYNDVNFRFINYSNIIALE